MVVRIPAGPLGSLKCDPPKGNGRRPQKNYRRAEKLQQAENELHDSLPDHIKEAVQGKRILLLEERLKTTEFPDLQVVEDFKHGVDLVGEEPPSPLFLEKLQPASMTAEQLEMTAAMNRGLAMSRPLTEHEQPHANRLVELSQEEVEERFLSDPYFSEDEVFQKLGTTAWTLTKCGSLDPCGCNLAVERPDFH